MDEIVGSHLEAEKFVDFLVLRGQKDHRHFAFLPQPPEQLHPVHARHLDVEDCEIRRIAHDPVKGGNAVRIGDNLISFSFEKHAEGR